MPGKFLKTFSSQYPYHRLSFYYPGLVLLALLAFGLTGCAHMMGLEQPPRVSVVDIRPVAISLLEQRYLIRVRVQNPNRASLTIEGMDYHISINNKDFADGVSNQRLTIAGYEEKNLDLGLSSTLLQLFEQLKGLAENHGRIDYSIKGHLRLRTPSAVVPFENHGEVDLRFAPEPKNHTAGQAPPPPNNI